MRSLLSGMSCSVDWQLVVSTEGQSIGPIFKGQAVQEEWKDIPAVSPDSVEYNVTFSETPF
jgi:hypothetical protein